MHGTPHIFDPAQDTGSKQATEKKELPAWVGWVAGGVLVVGALIVLIVTVTGHAPW